MIDEGKAAEINQLAFQLHNIITDLLKGIEPEDHSGQLTEEYLRLTTALLGCKVIIEHMGRAIGDNSGRSN